MTPPSYRVYRTSAAHDAFRRGEVVGSITAMTWDSAWDYLWYLSRKGFTAWVEPIDRKTMLGITLHAAQQRVSDFFDDPRLGRLQDTDI